MSTTIQGVVVWAGDEKKYGNYSFKLKDNDKWFRSQQRCEDIIKPGYEIKALVEEDEKGNYTLKRAPKLIKKGEPPQRGGGGKRGGWGGGRKDPAVEKRIVWQHSQEMAIDAARLLIEQEAVKLGAKNKPEERKVQILALIDELTVKFHNESFKPDAVLEAEKEVDDDWGDDSETESEEATEDFDDEIPWDED